MRARSQELQGLLELPSLRDEAARRAGFRQSFASLALETTTDGPSPLEGVETEALARGVKAALEDGLFDRLDWLSPAAVGAALFEIAGALPTGNEKRELGRRLLGRLNEARADAFAAIATRMALGSRKGLSGAAIRARVSLLFSTSQVDAGALAFAIVSRRELAREWIAGPSTRSLPARRLAARILERAAVVAARRASQGDDYAPRVFSTEAVAAPFARLLADREPLVWRHAAIARGLLAGVVGPQWKATTDALHPRLSPTEWRRGAVSIASAIATAPDRALPRALDLVEGTLAHHDKGLVATAAWGLPRAFEAEPEAAQQLLDAIVERDALGTAEAASSMSRELGPDVARASIERVRAALIDRAAKHEGDEGELVIARALAEELSAERSGDGSVRETVARALQVWIEAGTREAHTAALDALETARGALATLESLEGADDARARRAAILTLRDLDAALLEDASLGELLQLRSAMPALRTTASGAIGAADEDTMGPVEELHERMSRWILSREREKNRDGSSGRRLRALLRLLDSESARGEDADESPRAVRARRRRCEAISLLFSRLVRDRPTPLHRTLCAALARGIDALVREGTCDPVDVLIVGAALLDDPTDHETLAEASMDPDVGATLGAWAKFTRAGSLEEPKTIAVAGRGPDSLSPPASLPPEERGAASIAAKLEAMLELAAALGDDASGRAESLRGVLVRCARALRTLESTTARKSFGEATVAFQSLGAALQSYAQMDQGARQRVLGADATSRSSAFSGAFSGVGDRIALLLAHLADASTDDARAALDEAKIAVARLVPTPLKKLVFEVLELALDRPWESAEVTLLTRPKVAAELPSWLGPRRTLGGFFVVRPLGGGGAASVFVAKRIEERHDPDAEQFALKVPDYDGAAARSLSEQEFLDFFRGEASALLGLPPSPNLARFVTFDLASRPKPILVMELIHGPTLERFVTGPTRASHTVARAFEVLDGVLAGLEVMHAHAIGHLDIKPSNVILRESRTPALVDFGLSGRHVRPGCATGSYGAPEVWGALPDDFTGAPSPLPADVYAFGAVAFEVLTGRVLFDAKTEVATIGQHLAHDGHPPALDRLQGARPVMELLEHTMRRDPRARWTVPQVRMALQAIAPRMQGAGWPLGG